MAIIDGKKISSKIEKKIISKINNQNLKLKLAIILVGNDPASQIYVAKKEKKCKEIGIDCEIYNYKENIIQNKLIGNIENLNKDKNITGILVQLPLPTQINPRDVLDSVNKEKDADGLNSYHLMKIMIGDEKIIPATPKGILKLFDEYNINLESKNVCIIGFSDVVGKPLATLCLNRGATVTVCHIKTNNLKKHTIGADIVMTATGVPHLIKEDMIKDGSIIIDIGISKVDNKIFGDVDFVNVKEKASFITPVPGGVGPMTIASLLDNMIQLKEIYK